MFSCWFYKARSINAVNCFYLSVALNEKLNEINMMKNRFELMAPAKDIPEGEEAIAQTHYITQVRGFSTEHRVTCRVCWCRRRLVSPVVNTSALTLPSASNQTSLEKEELRRKGDNLYAELCKAKEEISSMENTVMVFDHNNTAYHRSICQGKESRMSNGPKLCSASLYHAASATSRVVYNTCSDSSSASTELQ